MVIDGKQLFKEYLEKLKGEIKPNTLKVALLYFEKLDVTDVYIRSIRRVAEELGVEVYEHCFKNTDTKTIVINKIQELNVDNDINGIFLSNDVPKHISYSEVVNYLSYKKDIDCVTPHNIGLHFQGNNLVVPSTASSVINIIKMQFGDNYISGKNCVVLGRNVVVGKPIAMELLNNDGTVTICHSKTKNLEDYTKKADILVVSIGIPKFIKESMVNKNAVVIDVGINYDENNKLCGDVDFEGVYHKVSAITPVPGGVGQMTVAMFFQNLVNLSKI